MLRWACGHFSMLLDGRGCLGSINGRWTMCHVGAEMGHSLGHLTWEELWPLNAMLLYFNSINIGDHEEQPANTRHNADMLKYVALFHEASLIIL